MGNCSVLTSQTGKPKDRDADNFPEVTQLIGGEAGIWSKAVGSGVLMSPL